MKKVIMAMAGMSAVAAMAANPQVASTSSVTAAFDFRDDAVLEIAHSSQFFGIAYNDTVDWTAGGGSGSVALDAYVMDGHESSDPSDWTIAKTRLEVEHNGEGVDTWKPAMKRLYAVRMVCGSVTNTAFFDCTAAVDLSDGEPINGFDMVPIVAPGGEGCTGWSEDGPKVTLKDDDQNVLVEGQDYHLSYISNTVPGTAYVVVTGIGDYGGAVTGSYQVVSMTPTVASEDTTNNIALMTAVPDCGPRLAAMRTLAWNTSETFATAPYCSWKVGGETSPTLKARVSCAALASKDAEDPDPSAFMILNEAVGEGTFDLSTKPNSPSGWYMFKLELVDGENDPVGVFTARMKPYDSGTLIIFR